jgi:hypothetical protein
MRTENGDGAAIDVGVHGLVDDLDEIGEHTLVNGAGEGVASGERLVHRVRLVVVRGARRRARNCAEAQHLIQPRRRHAQQARYRIQHSHIPNLRWFGQITPLRVPISHLDAVFILDKLDIAQMQQRSNDFPNYRIDQQQKSNSKNEKTIVIIIVYHHQPDHQCQQLALHPSFPDNLYYH